MMGRHTKIAAAGLFGLTLLAAGPASAEESGIVVKGASGKGITVEREGDFSLQLKGYFQVLETMSEAEGDLSTETLVRRARLTLAGYVFDEHTGYKMELGFGPRDLDETGAPVLDAYLESTHLRDLALRVGQSKVPFDRQRLISSGNQQFVDRSLVVGAVQLDRDIGITLLSDDLFGMDGLFGYRLGIYGGEGRGRTTAPGGFLYLARAEVRPFGAFDDLSEGDLKRSPKPRLALAGSIAWNENAVRRGSNRGQALTGLADEFGGFDYLHLEADAHFKWNGFSLLAELLWRKSRDGRFTSERDGETSTIVPSNTWGWFVQGGQMIGDHFEVVARYSELDAHAGENDPELLADLASEAREVGAGLNWYVHGHELKVQADVFRFWGRDRAGDAGVAFADGATQARLQLQARF